MFALRSGCVRVVDRNQGLAMREQESGLNDSGDLQRGSNIGRGQVLAADYFIIPDISRQNANSGGGNFGGLAGSFLPGGWGAVAASISVKSSEADTLLTLVDARTTEQMYIAEGHAKKTDVGFGGGGGWGGWAGFGGLAGSGYTNTDIGKVIMAALFQRLRRPGALHAEPAAGHGPGRCADRRPAGDHRRPPAHPAVHRCGVPLHGAHRRPGLSHRQARRHLDGSGRRERQPRLDVLGLRHAALT